MTQRKPAGMSTSAWIEAQITKAQHAGQFEHLESSTDPFADLDQPYDPDWWVKKLIRRENLNALPEMQVLKREVEEFRISLPTITREEEVRSRVAAFNDRIQAVNLTNSAPLSSDLNVLDVEAMVGCWRTSRS